MLPLSLGRREAAAPIRLLVLGAHSDDAEIGCGGTVLQLASQGQLAEVCWVVLSGQGDRAEEARASAEEMLDGVPVTRILQPGFRDGFFPYDGADIKGFFEQELKAFAPDLILTHQRNDAHQDHRLTCELTWNSFRNHFILEYEVPKYDGDMGRPSFFVPLEEDVSRRKIAHLMKHFASQANKHWFTPDLFEGLLRLRGMECNSPTSHAEAFYSRKQVLG
jgi:LmbE family N-acetylglucosaminyl deacetylase